MTIAGVGQPKSEEDGWGPQMPNWDGKGTERGLLGLGETRKGAQGQILRKKGSLHELCRQPYIQTLNKWCDSVGAPPVVSGVSLKRAIAAGRFTAGYQPPTRARNTRHQQVLVPMPPDQELNFLQPFLLFMTAGYCKALHPPVEDSSDAAKAVLGFMMERKTLTQLLANVSQDVHSIHTSNTYTQYIYSIHIPNTYTQYIYPIHIPNTYTQYIYPIHIIPYIYPIHIIPYIYPIHVRSLCTQYRSRLQRVTNNQILAPASVPLNAWVRAGGDEEARLNCVRNLTAPEGDDGTFVTLVVEALLHVSRGRKTMRPFGELASVSTLAFQQIPFTYIGLTLAAMWPFIKRPHDKHKALTQAKQKRGCAHPMMGLWPHGTVHRYLHFLTVVRAQKTTLYQTYKAAGGRFHGEDTCVVAPNRGTNRQLVYTADDSEEDTDFV